MLTPKERTLRALRFERPDRLPKADFYWSEFEAIARKRRAIPPGVSLEEHYAVDMGLLFPDEGPYTTRAGTVRETDTERIRITPWGQKVREVKGAFFSEELESPIREQKDLDRQPFDPPMLPSRYEHFLDPSVYHPDKLCYFVKTGGPYLRSAFVRGQTEWLMDIAGDEGFAKELAWRMGDFLMQVGREAFKRWGDTSTGVWIFDDMASNRGPMFSPESFERILLPAYRHMVKSWKEAGASYVLLHSDGNIEVLLDMLIEAGIDGFNPVEPRSGMDLARLHEKYGKRAAFIGGMCNSVVLPRGPVEKVREQAERIIAAGRDGGVIIGAHSIGPDIPVEHYEAYVELVNSSRYE
ncbi:MAG: uroporphyrinogen decarboxylase family protein [Planctomycetota bacterium]